MENRISYELNYAINETQTQLKNFRALLKCPICGNPAMHIGECKKLEPEECGCKYGGFKVEIQCESNQNHKYVFSFGDHKAMVGFTIHAE